MAKIKLSNVWVEYPIYSINGRSLKNKLLSVGTGGRIGLGHNAVVCVQALKGINLEVEHGDKLALIGPNGAGKSTLIRVMAGVYEPSFGYVHREGEVTSLLSVALGIDSESTGYDNIHIRGILMGMSRREINKRTKDIVEFSDLGDFIHMPVRTYSTGMRLRLAFAICTANDAEILLMDEWLGAGDADFVEKARARLNEMVQKSRILVLASHNAELLSKICNKGIYLHQGTIIAAGGIQEVLDKYQAAQEAFRARMAREGANANVH